MSIATFLVSIRPGPPDRGFFLIPMLMEEDLLIIKFFERFRLNVPGTPDAFPRWGKVTVKSNTRAGTLRLKNIDREEALRIIEERGLVQTHSDRDGAVFDTPGRSFQKKYRRIPVPVLL